MALTCDSDGNLITTFCLKHAEEEKCRQEEIHKIKLEALEWRIKEGEQNG